MNRASKILSILFLSAYIFTAAGCAPPEERGYLDCLECAATLSVSGICRGVDFSADISLSERGADGGRDATLVYTSPDAVRGLSVRCEGGVYALTLGAVTRSGVAAERLALPIIVFSPRGEVSSVERSLAPDGSALTLITQSTDMGVILWTLDSNSGAPTALTLTDHGGSVILEIDIDHTEINKSQD